MGEMDRLRWRCRRGLLELDIVLTRFLDGPYAALSPAQRDTFSALLTLADNDLWDLVAGRSDAQTPPEQEIVERLRQA
jgi:antitoxin CptB